MYRMMMSYRTAVATVARRSQAMPRTFESIHCNHPRMAPQQQKQHKLLQQIRFLRSGPMVDAEMVSPRLADLEKAIQNHERLLGKNENKNSDDSTNDETDGAKVTQADIRESLEVIADLQFELEQWKDFLLTRQQLHEHCKSNFELARSHHFLGVARKNLNDYELSKKHLEQSLNHFQLMYPNQFHVNIGRGWYELAILFHDQLELGAARHYLNMAEPHFRFDGQDMFDVDDNPSQIILEEEALDQRTNAEAVGNEREPISTTDSDKKPEHAPHPELRNVLESQAQILRFMNDHLEALKVYRELEDLYGLDSRLRFDVASSFLCLGKRKQAKKLYEKVMETTDPDSVIASNVHHQLGLCHAYETDEQEEALKHFEIAYNLRKRLLGETHPWVGQTVNCLGGMQASLNQFGKALTSLREALLIARFNSECDVSEEDADVKHIMKNISLIQKNMNVSQHSNPFQD